MEIIKTIFLSSVIALFLVSASAPPRRKGNDGFLVALIFVSVAVSLAMFFLKNIK
jgi:hypothetical protein